MDSTILLDPLFFLLFIPDSFYMENIVCIQVISYVDYFMFSNL